MSLKAITDLLQHDEPAVRDLGARAVRYRSQYDQDEITAPEYANLCAQLTDLETLQAKANSEDERQAIALAVQFLKTYLPVLL